MKKISHYLYLILIYLFLYLPIALVIFSSFNQAKRSFIWQGFTWQSYQALFQDSSIWEATWHSLVLGTLTAFSATFIGFLMVFSNFRYHFWGDKIIYNFTKILVMIPEIVIAVSLLLLYNCFHLPLGFWSLFLGHTALCIPFTTITLADQLFNLDRGIFAAALDLGASDWFIVKKITLPLMSSSLAAAWLLSFTLSIDDIIISYFVGGPTFNVLPFKIYAMIRFGINPEINALCSLMMIFTLIMTFTTYYLLRHKFYE